MKYVIEIVLACKHKSYPHPCLNCKNKVSGWISKDAKFTTKIDERFMWQQKQDADLMAKFLNSIGDNTYRVVGEL